MSSFALATTFVVGSAGEYRAQTRYTGQVMDAKTAQTIRSYMAYTVENKYGSENFPDGYHELIRTLDKLLG